MDAMAYVLGIVIEIIPILILVYVFMVAFTFIKPNHLKKMIQESHPVLRYLLMGILGTLSHGPIYAWYPFLKDLYEKGLTKGSIGAFLYARGIKLTLIPLFISFFGLKYVLLFMVFLFIFSLVEGFFLDLFLKRDL